MGLLFYILGVMTGLVVGAIVFISVIGIMSREIIEKLTTGNFTRHIIQDKLKIGKKWAKMFEAPLDADIQINKKLQTNSEKGVDTPLDEIL